VAFESVLALGSSGKNGSHNAQIGGLYLRCCRIKNPINQTCLVTFHHSNVGKSATGVQFNKIFRGILWHDSSDEQIAISLLGQNIEGHEPLLAHRTGSLSLFINSRCLQNETRSALIYLT